MSEIAETYLVISLLMAVFAAVAAVGTALVLGVGFERLRCGFEIVRKQTAFFSDAIHKLDERTGALDSRTGLLERQTAILDHKATALELHQNELAGEIGKVAAGAGHAASRDDRHLAGEMLAEVAAMAGQLKAQQARLKKIPQQDNRLFSFSVPYPMRGYTLPSSEGHGLEQIRLN